MPEYKFVKYETFDEGRVVRILLNRPDARTRRTGDARRARRGVPGGRGGRQVRVVILGGEGLDVLLRPRHGLEGLDARSTCPARTSIRPQRSTAAPARAPRSVMLQEWHYFFQNTLRWRNLRKITIAQVHGDVYAGGAHADVGLRPDRRLRGGALRRRGRHPARHVRRRVLRPPVGVRAAQDQGAAAHRRLHRHPRGPPPRHGVEGVHARGARRADARVRPAHRQLSRR